MIRGISFDLDHTLYDRDATYEKMLPEFMQFFAKYLRDDVTPDEVLGTIQRCDRSGIYKSGHWEGIYRDTLESRIFAQAPSYEVYYEQFIEKVYPSCMVLYDDTIPVIEQFRQNGYKVAILTNGPSVYQRTKIGIVSLDKYVDGILVGSELPSEKPNPIAFQSICKLMGCGLGEAVYVGDHPINDVDGARKAGMIPVWFRSVDIWFDSIPPSPYSVNRLGEIPPLVEKINGLNA